MAVRFGAGRFTSFLLVLGLATVATMLFFPLPYVIYAGLLHGEAASHGLAQWLVFTTASALYAFAVIGVRLYFPYGLIALFGFALWLAVRLR